MEPEPLTPGPARAGTASASPAIDPSVARLGLLGVVLCGGASRRMGADKARLLMEGEALYARTARVLSAFAGEVVLASGPARRLLDPRYAEVEDAAPHLAEVAPPQATRRTAGVAASGDGASGDGAAGDGAAGDGASARLGPLASLVGAIERAASLGHVGIVAAACDLARLSPEVIAPLVERVTRGKAECAYWTRDGRAEPLCVVVSAAASQRLRGAFEAGVRRPVEAFAALRVEVAEVPAELAHFLTNVNTPEDLSPLSSAYVSSLSATDLVAQDHVPYGSAR